MADTTPTETLEREHRVIEHIVAAAPAIADTLAAGRPVPVEALRRMVEFMRDYADRCHHGKEETHLFPLLVRRGVPETGCPIGALLHEHVAGRNLVGKIEAAVPAYETGDAAAAAALAHSLRSLAELYRGHIWKEDFLLFPMTEKVLTDDDKLDLARLFAEVDAELGPQGLLRLEQLAGDLALLAADLAAGNPAGD